MEWFYYEIYNIICKNNKNRKLSGQRKKPKRSGSNRFGFRLFRCADLVCARRLFEGGEGGVHIPVGCKALKQLVQWS
jgi:hypothetical protein